MTVSDSRRRRDRMGRRETAVWWTVLVVLGMLLLIGPTAFVVSFWPV